MTGQNRNILGAVSTFALLASVATAAQADTWRYAFEESMDEVQGK